MMIRTAIAIPAACLLLLGCLEAPTERNNPLDRDSDVELRIVGLPDTINSILEVVNVELESDVPLIDGTVVTWSSNQLAETAPRTFTPFNATYRPLLSTLRATLGPARNPRFVEKSFVIRQWPAATTLSCQPDCTLASHLEDFRVVTEVRDSLGSVVNGFTWGAAPFQYEIRDTTILERRFGDGVLDLVIRTRIDGQTWVVFRGGQAFHLVDSILVTVQQAAARPIVECPTAMFVGQTRQITVSEWRDARGNPYGGTVFPNVIWDPGHPNNPSDPGGVDVTVTPDGQVTAHAAGVWYTTATVEGRGPEIAAVCQIFISN